MPEISRFLGIVIAMYFDDHQPPHFHAMYAEHDVAIVIQDGSIIAGEFPKRALSHVREWRALHLAELEEDWDLSRKRLTPKKIALWSNACHEFWKRDTSVITPSTSNSATAPRGT